MNIAAHLRLAMSRKNMTVFQLSAASSVSMTTISRMLMGQEEFHLSSVQSVFDILEVDICFIPRRVVSKEGDLSEDQLMRINNFLKRQQ